MLLNLFVLREFFLAVARLLPRRSSVIVRQRLQSLPTLRYPISPNPKFALLVFIQARVPRPLEFFHSSREVRKQVACRRRGAKRGEDRNGRRLDKISERESREQRRREPKETRRRKGISGSGEGENQWASVGSEGAENRLRGGKDRIRIG